MANKNQTQAADIALKKLENRIEDLVSVVTTLKDENDALSSSHETLSAERFKLMEKNEMARSRVDAMIVRLKAMEK